LLGAVGTTEITTWWRPDRPPVEVVRGPSQIKRSDPPLYKIEIPLSGSMLLEQEGRQAVLGPGDLGFIDTSRPCRWIVSSTRFAFLVIPRPLLPVHPRAAAHLCGTRFTGARGAGALVSGLARQAIERLDEVDASDGVRIGSTLVDLLTVTLDARLGRAEATSPETRRRALLLEIHAFIERRLADPDLSPAQIAQHHHISLRLLHKLFEEQQETVGAWIRRRRLERCRRDLQNPALRDRSVAAIAARSGFREASHFSRAFRREYGLTPTEFRNIDPRPAKPPRDQASGGTRLCSSRSPSAGQT
jgi:AraC-like DNA-binding protein